MKPAPAVTTTFLIWNALIIGQIVFMFVLSNGEPREGYKSLADTFALVAGASAAMSFVMRHLLFAGFRSGKLMIDSAQGQVSFIAGHVIVFALSEGVGVLGFVNGLGSSSKDEWPPFIGGAILLLLIHIPLPSRFRPENVRI